MALSEIFWAGSSGLLGTGGNAMRNRHNLPAFLQNIVLISICCFASSALAWRETGHFVVCEIGYRHLTPKARVAVDQILDGKSFAEQCTWPDMIRKSAAWKHTGDWHFYNLEDNQLPLAAGTLSLNQGIMQGLLRAEDTLRSDQSGVVEKRQALRFLGHLMGDAHQPLHLGRAKDIGGNLVDVQWFGSEKFTSVEILIAEAASPKCDGSGQFIHDATEECVVKNITHKRHNLHKVWDLQLLEYFIRREGLKSSAGDSEYLHKAYADAIDTRFNDNERELLLHKTLLDFVSESFFFARSHAYNLGHTRNLGEAYASSRIELVNTRLRQAGYRLAAALNRIFDQESQRGLRFRDWEFRMLDLGPRVRKTLTEL